MSAGSLTEWPVQNPAGTGLGDTSKSAGTHRASPLNITDRKTVLSALANFATAMPAEKRKQVIRVKVNYGNGDERRRLSKLVTEVFLDMLDVIEKTQKQS